MPDAANKENYKGIFEGVLGFGQKAAVIVVDFTKAYTTPASHWFCGGKGPPETPKSIRQRNGNTIQNRTKKTEC